MDVLDLVRAADADTDYLSRGVVQLYLAAVILEEQFEETLSGR